MIYIVLSAQCIIMSFINQKLHCTLTRDTSNILHISKAFVKNVARLNGMMLSYIDFDIGLLNINQSNWHIETD